MSSAYLTHKYSNFYNEKNAMKDDDYDEYENDNESSFRRICCVVKSTLCVATCTSIVGLLMFVRSILVGGPDL